jgi:hypothetical protein
MPNLNKINPTAEALPPRTSINADKQTEQRHSENHFLLFVNGGG